jgi:uncharacterized protein YyaL (SSP411 family)
VRLWIAIAIAIGGCGKRSSGEGVTILPGAPPVTRELAEKLSAAPRPKALHTRHRRPGGEPLYRNRLVLEASPYLIQHAHNPVDWRPWGEEAFADARRLGRPILVSVGYSTCHWCHVMAEESFEDLEIATYLNQHYVCIKVDREERPDVDATYLAAMEAMGQPGGWPLNVWLTPDGAPYFATTYLPPRDGDRGVSAGFLTLLRRGRELDRAAKSAGELAAAMRRLAAPPAAGPALGPAAIGEAVAVYRRIFDRDNGGVRQPGQRNKFPADLPVRLLLRHARRAGDAEARAMAELTLDRMAAGGLRDHVGGGFHRYATDARWLVPHFEKMLYDNALLVVAYLEGHQATGRADFAEVAREVLAFVERDLAAPEGGYYAALDADSAGPDGTVAEGLFYTWTPAELEAALGESAALVRAYHGASEAGNFEGRSVLSAPRPLAEVAAALGLEEGRAREMLAAARPRLLAARQARPPPHRDEKILAGWNGLMISALVRAALVLDGGAAGSEYLARARRTAERVSAALMADDGRLLRVWAGGRGYTPGMLEDHAYLAAGFLDLFEATAEARWLERAIALDRILARDFEDPAGGFFASAGGGDPRLLRHKPFEDGAVPSGNSVHALTLLRLGLLTGRAVYRERADRLFSAAAGAVAASPAASADLLLAVDFRTDRPREVVLVAPVARDQLAPFQAVLARTFAPNRVTLGLTEDEAPALTALVPLLEGKLAIGGRATAFVCTEGVCKLPARDPAGFEKQLAPR